MASRNAAPGDVDGGLVVGIAPVSRHLDLKGVAAAVGGKKAAMAEPATAERASGYVVGRPDPVPGSVPGVSRW